MILYELRCGAGHGFEAWFRNSDTYDEQSAAAQVSCPVCGDCDVGKVPMAPRIGRGSRPTQAEHMQMVMTKIAELNQHIAETCDYVGPDFAEEARKIHYGETEHREIYGEASVDDVEELQEEGIAVRPIPWVRRKDS
jgi:hypothetical protein